ncbi:HET-domain-containing protein [Podospora aff. communis PSN243]|uniref:HET-domain-containing protein n=1 Tax=Podospora aff. communis PSN243 TaxID=3040156 RepID=A0AAV9GCF2_9PEZI|nr:HET-domain-containing protein [Podospora aff. communis PSN243]
MLPALRFLIFSDPPPSVHSNILCFTLTPNIPLQRSRKSTSIMATANMRRGRRAEVADRLAIRRARMHHLIHNNDTVSESVPLFQYSPLPDDSIRFLQLLHDPDKNAPVRCTISHLMLPDDRHGETSCLFEALSYVWGPGVKDKSVLIQTDFGTTRMGVTTSVHEALLRLRDPFIDRFIWADAICINQDDVDERERQVRMMARVYASASRVLVWLGNDEGDGANALRSLLRMARPGAQPLPSDSGALCALLKRPWFTRMWVLQEVAVARQVSVMYGSLMTEGQAFCIGLMSLCPLVEDQSLQWLARSAAQLMQGAAFRPRFALQYSDANPFGEDITGTRTKTLGELIDMFHDRKATKPHDKIFALLGLCTDTAVDGLLPNYSIPWSELFRRLIVHLLGNNAVAVKTWDV